MLTVIVFIIVYLFDLEAQQNSKGGKWCVNMNVYLLYGLITHSSKEVFYYFIYALKYH